MTDTVNYATEGAVAVIAMNRPDSLNGFTAGLCGDLLECFERADADDGVRVVVFTGEGRAFSAGADLKAGVEGARNVRGKLLYEYQPVLTAIEQIPKPVIAAVNGFAAGIGLSFALHCDLVIMADDAFLLSPFSTISLVPDGGANWQLVRQLGYRRAYELAVEAQRIGADRCFELGLVNRIAPAARLRAEALAWAGELAGRAPLSLAATKKAMRAAMDQDWASCYRLEAELQQQLHASSDAREGVDAFLNKRPPRFEGK